MKQYLDLLRHVHESGRTKGDRSGFWLRSAFGYQMRFDLSKGFPLVTTKKMFWKGIVHELLWFISGSTNVKYLQENDVHIWDGFADENGELGPVYGSQWRRWPRADGRHFDQLAWAIDMIKKQPISKAIIVNTWNAGMISEMRLPPCHTMFQFNVSHGKLDCQLYQRSSDVFLGVPFNIAEYSLLTMMIAQITGLEPGEFIHTLGDVHYYKNHKAQVIEQLELKPLPLPQVKLNPKIQNIDDFRFEDIELQNYKHLGKIMAPVVII